MDIYLFKKQLKLQGIQGIALDIDETLSWTVGYWVEKMQEKFGNPENLTVKELITKYRYTQHVPYWQTEEAFAWMKEHRNSNEVQEILPLIENAHTFVQQINEIVPIVLYLTTRPQTVINGTKKWLQKHNFPEKVVIARPPEVHITEGNQWKAHVLEELYPEVMGIIDDNAGLANHLSTNYKGVVYLYDNTMHSRTDIRVIPCMTWEDVLQKVSSSK